MSDTSTKNPPVTSFTYGTVNVAVFANDGDNGDGPSYAAVPSRRYRDSEGNWASSKSFYLKDLVLLQRAIAKAVDYMESVEEQTSGF